MTVREALAWCALALWATWGFALSAELARAPLGTWAPDLGLVLFVAFASDARTRALPGAAIAFAMAMAATSIEPPLASLAWCLACAGVVRVLRLALDVSHRAPLALLAFGAVLGGQAWFALVHAAQVERELAAAALMARAAPAPLEAAWSAGGGALSSALVAALVGPALRRLPGLGPLERRRTWPTAASSR